jgi:hypothetical protein
MAVDGLFSESYLNPMAKKQHVLLTNQVESPTKWKYKPRKVKPQEEDIVKDYTQMADRFEQDSARFVEERTARIQHRTLNIPAHIEYIDIRFQDQFDLNKYSRSYLRDFGLEAVKFTEFNRKILFAIVDQDRFTTFFTKINAFILFGRGDQDAPIDKRMLYIHDFALHSSSKIKRYDSINSVVRFSLLESLAGFTLVNQIEQSLERYLIANNKVFNFDHANNFIEVIGADLDLTEEIIDNFDVIFSVTSSLSSVISPTRFRLPVRSYGFTVANAEEALPLIGIIDTGIDRQTPLAPLISGSIDKTGTDPLIDSENHGTAVAALAALGKRPYLSGFRGSISADAKLLSLKVMNTSPAALPDFNVINIIREAKINYPSIKLFVLTISYEKTRIENEHVTDYAYQLDKLSHDLGILVFISTANNEQASGQNTSYNISYFTQDQTNLCAPAESMNNMTIGACADNLKQGTFLGIAPLKEFPALYSRRNCQNQSAFFSPRKINKHLRKPDILLPGGDYEVRGNFMGTGDDATMEVLSSNPAEGFYKNVGTSFASPLAANLGAQLQKLYPNIKSQSIKALILNASSADLITTDSDQDLFLNRVIGYGIPHDEKVLFSNLNKVTFLIEQEITHKDLISIPIALPDYLKRVEKKRGLLKITATLCFSFQPERDNHLAYCPIFMAFTFFKNKTTEEIRSNYSDSILRNRWSQDGYSQAKPILYSNVQKLEFSIGREDIVSEDGIIKVGVHCMVSPQIKATLSQRRNIITESFKFSIAITIEEKQSERNLTNRLYNEIIAINEVENIGTIDLDNDLSIE